MKVNGFWKKTLCLVLTMAMVLGNASPVVAAHEHETAAEIVTEITNATIKEAEKLINKTGLMNAADVTDTKNSLEEADSNLAGSMDNLGTAVEDAQAAIDELEGKVTKDDATKINASLSVAYDEASSAWENAVAVSDAAVADLEKAAAAHAAASKISDEAAKVAEAELKAAQEALNAAVEATKFANDNMVSLKNEFAKATELATKWSTEVETALAEATAKFEEAQVALNSALEALESGDAELKAAIDTFKACYNAFITAANTFKTSIQTAIDAQNTLEGLYAEYEAAQKAYAEALAAYEAKCTEYAEAELLATYENYNEKLNSLNQDLEDLKDDLKDAEADEAEALAAWEAALLGTDYLAMKELTDILAKVPETDEEKAAIEKAAYKAAVYVIEKKLANGRTVINVDKEGNNAEGVPTYGKASEDYFAVLNDNGEAVSRYDYKLNYDENGKGVVNIYEMVPTEDVTNYVDYNGTKKELHLVAGNQYYIELGLGSTVELVKNENNEYVETLVAEQTFAQNPAEIPTKVNVVGLIEYIIKNVFHFDLPLKHDDTGYYIEYGIFSKKRADINVNVELKEEKIGNEVKYAIVILEDVKILGISCEIRLPLEVTQRADNTKYDVKYVYNESAYIDVPGTVFPETLPQAVYEGKAHTVQGGNLTGLYIEIPTAVEGEAATRKDLKFVQVGDKQGVGYYTYEVKHAFIQGGTADTMFALKETALGVDSNVYEKEVLGLKNTYLKCGEECERIEGLIQGKEEEITAFKATYADLASAYDVMKATEEPAKEKEIGELAGLPKNIGELVKGLDGEELSALLKAIMEISSNGETVDYNAILNVLKTVISETTAGRLLYVLADDATDGWGSIIGGIIGGITGGEKPVPPTKFERAYANAWVNALTTKIKVVQNAIKLVETAVATVEAGVTAVTEGIELAEVAVDAVLATAEKKLLEATVEVLVMANDVMNSSEEIVLSIDSIIAEAQARTEKAYLVAVAERNALNQVTFTRPYAAKLDETLVAIGVANALNTELTADIALAEAPLASAKALYEGLKYLEEHEHEYESATTAPTCEETGSIVHVCTICTHTYTEVLDATGHAYESEVTDPTCTDKGYTTYTCTVCGDSYESDEVAALGHAYDSVVTNPNCTTGGHTTHTCKVCGHSYVDAENGALGHDTTTVTTVEPTCTEVGSATTTCSRCDYINTEELPALDHDTTTVTVAATCTEAGSETTTCSRCDYINTEELPALGHDTTTVTVAATCTEVGSETTTCSRCDYINTEEFPALGHDTTTVTVSATCTQDGLATTTCSNCDYKEEEILKAVGHTYETTTVPATCTQDGSVTYKCTCGDTIVDIIPAKGHDYKSVVTAPTCTAGGYTTHTCICGDSYITDNKAALEHEFESVVTAPTCTVDGYTTYTCTRIGCNVSYQDTTVTAPGHNWGEWEVTKPATDTEFGEEIRHCKVEGCKGSETREIDPTAHEHAWYVLEVKEATCTEGGYTIYACSKCNQKNTTDIKAELSHSFGEWTVEEAATCTEPGTEVRVCERCNNATEEQTIQAIGHAWGEWEVTTPVTEFVNGLETRACSACDAIEENKIPAPGHNYVVTAVVEPTCTERGYTTYTCTHSECNNDSYNADYVEALGHSETAVVTDPTCTDKGYTTYTCTVCGTIRTADATSALGHDYVPTVTAPTCTEAGYTTYTCSRGDSSYVADEVAALGHSFGEWTVEEAATCTKEGREAQICVTCGEKVTRAIATLGHSFGEWTVAEAATCTVVGTEVRVCTVCDAEETRAIDALGHSYAAVVTAPTCTANGYTTHTCATCNDTFTDTVVAATGHSYTATEIAPTCTAGGYTGYECECGVYIVGNMTNALGHTWGAWTVTTAATETATGVETRECATCHATETNTLAMLTDTPVVGDNTGNEVEIDDEETPLAGGEVEGEVIIEDEETPLASGEIKVEVVASEEVVAKAEEQVNALVEQIIAGETVSETAVSEETVAKITEAVDNGEEIIVKVVAEVIEEKVVPTEDKAQVEETVEELTVIDVEDVVIVQFVDLAVEIYTSSGEKLGNYNELPEKLTFTVAIPEGMDTEGKTFVIIRVHNGEVTILDTVMNEDGTLSFETDKFSTYAIAYKEIVNSVVIEEIEIPLTNGTSNFGLIFALVGALAVIGAGVMVTVSQRKKSSGR